VHARLQQERANPRFAARVADKLGAVLNRGLSRQPAPSPPYRFGSATELTGRLQEIRALVDPRVEGVGKVLLHADAKDGMFEGGAVAAFSTTVTITPGATHEDLATGLLVRDLDAEGDDRVPVPDARYNVKPHPSGRLRFDFELPELRPGRYTVRVAFTVKDSGHEPTTADGHFEIRPPPGYVPPADEPAPESQALRFPGSADRPAHDAELDAPGFEDSDPFGDQAFDPEQDAFPSPIAPSDPGSTPGPHPSDGGHADAPPPVLHAVPTPPPSTSGGASQADASHAGPGSQAGAPRPRLGIAPSVADPSAPDASSASSQAGSAPDLAPIPSIRPSDAEPHADVTREAPHPTASSPSWGPGGGRWEELPDVDDPAPPHAPTGASSAGPGARGGDGSSGSPGAAGGYGAPGPLSGLDDPGGGLLPTPEGMEDLPGFDDPQPDALSALIEQVTGFLRENAMVALVIVVGVLVLLLVLAGLIFQALAG